ncbi:phosphodiester glycosidase family protein [Prosthecobacter sp.]|uniref:phosphodiester glycosidase family protein n=1 Tax=Prosthecobacter sp. TaxID=1965333 RepID=UPI00378490C0
MRHFTTTSLTLSLLWLAAATVNAYGQNLAPKAPEPTGWRGLVPGIELGLFPAPGGLGRMQIVRVDVRSHPLQLCSSSASQPMLTAEEWAAKKKLCLVINAGMYDKDGSTHCGYLKNHDFIQPAVFRSDYSSLCVFSPLAKETAPFRLLDTDDAGVEKDVLSRYDVVIQNLRLIKHPGENRWKQQPKMWSEAALGEDKDGHALFIFCRTPSTMHDFNEHLLKLPIGIVSAQHLDGGPPASFYLNCGGVVIRGVGGYESGFNENSGSQKFWLLPHVIGVRAP